QRQLPAGDERVADEDEVLRPQRERADLEQLQVRPVDVRHRRLPVGPQHPEPELLVQVGTALLDLPPGPLAHLVVPRQVMHPVRPGVARTRSMARRRVFSRRSGGGIGGTEEEGFTTAAQGTQRRRYTEETRKSSSLYSLLCVLCASVVNSS